MITNQSLRRDFRFTNDRLGLSKSPSITHITRIQKKLVIRKIRGEKKHGIIKNP